MQTGWLLQCPAPFVAPAPGHWAEPGFASSSRSQQGSAVDHDVSSDVLCTGRASYPLAHPDATGSMASSDSVSLERTVVDQQFVNPVIGNSGGCNSVTHPYATGSMASSSDAATHAVRYHRSNVCQLLTKPVLGKGGRCNSLERPNASSSMASSSDIAKHAGSQQRSQVDQQLMNPVLVNGEGFNCLKNPSAFGSMANSADAPKHAASQQRSKIDQQHMSPVPSFDGRSNLLQRTNETGSIADAVPGPAAPKTVQPPPRPPTGFEQMDSEGNLGQGGCHVESQKSALDALAAMCEAAEGYQQQAQHAAAEVSKFLREARVILSWAISGVRPQQSRPGEGRLEQQEPTKHLQECQRQGQQSDTGILQMEHSPPNINQFWQRLGQMEGPVAKRQAPPWIHQLEENVRKSEPRFEVQQASVETNSSSPVPASSGGLETLREATGEDTRIGTENMPGSKEYLRILRERLIRKQREMLMAHSPPTTKQEEQQASIEACSSSSATGSNHGLETVTEEQCEDAENGTEDATQRVARQKKNKLNPQRRRERRERLMWQQSEMHAEQSPPTNQFSPWLEQTEDQVASEEPPTWFHQPEQNWRWSERRFEGQQASVEANWSSSAAAWNAAQNGAEDATQSAPWAWPKSKNKLNPRRRKERRDQLMRQQGEMPTEDQVASEEPPTWFDQPEEDVRRWGPRFEEQPASVEAASSASAAAWNVAQERVLDATGEDAENGTEDATQSVPWAWPKPKSKLNPRRRRERREKLMRQQGEMPTEDPQPTTNHFWQPWEQTEDQVASEEPPTWVDQPEEDVRRWGPRFEEQPASVEAASSASAAAWNVAQERVLDATGEDAENGTEDATQSVPWAWPKPKSKLNPRRRMERRERLLRENNASYTVWL